MFHFTYIGIPTPTFPAPLPRRLASVLLQSRSIHSNSPARAANRPLRPLSYEELIQRKRDEEKRLQDLELAKQKYEAERKSAFLPPSQSPVGSAFAPRRGSRRFLRALYKNFAARNKTSYPFPETLPQIGGVIKRRKTYFKKGHQLLKARQKRLFTKTLEYILKRRKMMNISARRAAFTIFRKEKFEENEVTATKEEVMQWKEGDDTYVLPITTADIDKVSSKAVTLRKHTATQLAIRLAASVLREDCVIAFPTETVYGLGANALSTTAVEKIYKAKGRPSDNPLIVHFGSLDHLRSFSEIPDVYLPLLKKFSPGPVTILLKVKPEMNISPVVTAGLDTVAVRIPASPLARALILEANLPIAAPSANASTRPSPTLAEHVNADLNGRLPLILSADGDTGSQCDVGLESTVVDGLSDPPTILRLGGVSLEQIQGLGGRWQNTIIYQKPKTDINGDQEFKPRTPGMKYRHYSPRCPVYVYPFNSPQPTSPPSLLPSSDIPRRKIAVLCTHNWEPKEIPNADVQYNWMGDNGEDVARNLFKCVREMDEWGAEIILVEGVEEVGIGRSVMERLRKMAGDTLQETEPEKA